MVVYDDSQNRSDGVCIARMVWAPQEGDKVHVLLRQNKPNDNQ
jgi:hypothetical protein